MKHEIAAVRRPFVRSIAPLPSAALLALGMLFLAFPGASESLAQGTSITVLYGSEDGTFGKASVRIAADHETDETEPPGDSVSLAGFEEASESNLDAAAAGHREALLFVPASGTDRDETLRWAGKIARELDLGGLALAFGWSDGTSAAAALADWLSAIDKETGLEELHVVLHGDGDTVFNRAMVAAREEGFDLSVNGSRIDYASGAGAPDPNSSKTRSTGTFTTRGAGGKAPGAATPDRPTEPEEESKEFHTVNVYYGTDRKPTPNTTENDRYGTERNREGPMEYGRTTISIPLHHKIGVVERPKWYKLEFSEDPKKHVTIVELEKMAAGDFFSEVGGVASAKQKNEALLFVHGFNVPFDDAVRRTGQIAFDLDFGGVALSYSWPSQGSLKAYTIDEANAEWSVPHLTQFLMDLQEQTEIERIHVIAHSMGTRVLSYALANARDEGFDLDLHNVILAAPDIDVDVFKEQILPKITEASDKLTMYASSDDTALKVSQTIHGVARLGLSGDHILVTPGMDTVNASGIDTSMIGHGYYGSAKVVVTDIFNLVIKGLEPPKRKLILGPFGEWDFGKLKEPE